MVYIYSKHTDGIVALALSCRKEILVSYTDHIISCTSNQQFSSDQARGGLLVLVVVG